MTSTKKVSAFFAFLLAMLMLSCLPARGDASKSGCTHSDDQAKGCSSNDPVSVSEPETGRLIGVGMILFGGAVAASNGIRLIRSYLSSLRQ